MWRFKGSPHYLKAQAPRLGITQVLADRSRNNPEIYRVSVLLAQLCERYHKARKEDGRPVFGFSEREQIKSTLEQCELELQKLHMLAATSSAMMAEAWTAFDLEPPERPFAVVCNNERVRGMENGKRTDSVRSPGVLFPRPDSHLPLTLPLGDGTVGVPDDDVEPASSCGEQWPLVSGK